MLSPEDALKRIAARYDIENHYFAQREEWIYEIKTGVKFEVHKYGHKLIDHHMPYKQGQLTVFVLTQFVKGQHRGFDADMMFIDPYNALSVTGGHEGHYDAIEDLRIFTQQTGKSIFLNCHTVTETQRQKLDKSGATPVPMMSDVEGGGKFPNKADDVIVVHRNLYHMDEEERYTTLLYVGKVRNKEGGGQPTRFDEPIRMRFKRDWTGFETDEDKINQAYDDTNGWATLKAPF